MLNSFRAIFVIFSAAILVIPPQVSGGRHVAAGVTHGFEKKKLIEWGWDEPSTAFMRKNIERMETLPFDGVVFPLKDGNGLNLTWKMWGATKLEYSSLAYMVDDLTQTPFTSLRERFVRVNVTPGTVDWFDASAWRVVLDNFAVAAKVAKLGGCKGFMFDVEQYKAKLFDFSATNRKASREEYRDMVRQRGREWIAAVSGEFSNILILFPWAYHAYHANKSAYELLPDFLDGIFEGAPAGVRLVDAGESAYQCKTRSCFTWLYEKLKRDDARYSVIPERYKDKIEVGFGIWIDAQQDIIGWHPDDAQKNFFTPDELKTSVMTALEISEDYVWIYSEKLNWWTGDKVPAAYVEALRAAKAGG